MLSAVLAIAIGLGLWSLVSYYKRRGLESRFAHPLRQASCRLKFSIFGVESEDNVRDE